MCVEYLERLQRAGSRLCFYMTHTHLCVVCYVVNRG